MGEPNQFRYSEELRESTGNQAIPRDHRRLSKDQPEHARLNLHSRTYGQRNAGNWYCRERMTSARDLQEGMAFIIPVLQIEDARAICTIAAVVRRTPYTTAMECASLLAIFAISSGAFGITPRKRTGPFLPSSANADENGRHHIDIPAHFIVELHFGVHGFLLCLIYRYGFGGESDDLWYKFILSLYL